MKTAEFKSAEYIAYMNSDKWQEKRESRLRIDGYKCVMCGREDNLQVHHISYKQLGYENILTDLVTVCDSCHKKLHNYYKRDRGQAWQRE